MKTLRIALATCRTVPPWERDDAPLRAALRRRGFDVVEPTWDDVDFDWSKCDATLVRTTWDYTQRIDEFRRWIDQVSQACPIVNPAPVLRWNLDKRYLRELELHGVDIVPTRWIETVADLRGDDWRAWLCNDRIPAMGFMKPSVGATASGTLRFPLDAAGFAAAVAHAERLLEDGRAVLVQRYLPSVERIGERSAIIIDGRMTHAVEKRPQPGDYRVQDDWGGTDAPYAPDEAELRLVRRSIDAVNRAVDSPWTYARVDWLIAADGRPHLVELELVEPSLFFRHAPDAADALADSLLQFIRAASNRTDLTIVSGARTQTPNCG